MPRTIDSSAFLEQTTFDVSAPDHLSSMRGPGIPVKEIPHQEFPRVVYKHPTKPFKVIEHRNSQHEVVQVEHISAEHISKIVNNEAELKEALQAGFQKEPFIAPPLPDPNAELYEIPHETPRRK